MFVKVRLIPRRVRTAETFEAEDPWSGGRLATFNLDVYRLFPEHVRDPRDWREGTIHTLGSARLHAIRSESDGIERMLPAFLGDLVERKAIAARQLPALLHRVENELRTEDFRPPAKASTRTLALGALACAVAGTLAYLALAGAANEAMRASRPRVVDVADWRARAQSPGDAFVLQGMVPLESKEPAPSSLRLPETVERAAGSEWSLGVVRAAGGRRAVLVPAVSYERDGEVELGPVIVKAADELGLVADLARLRSRLPDLDTSSVACSRWPSRPAARPVVLARALALLLALAGLATALGCGASWLGSGPRRKRNQEWERRLLGDARGLDVGPG